MNQRKVNILWLALIAVLTCSALALWFTGGSSRKVDFDEEKFTVEDTAGISKIVITGGSVSNTLEKKNGIWKVNDRYLLDPAMEKVLMAVLYRVRVHRKAPKNLRDKIIKNLSENGYHVSVYADNKLIKSFIAGGNGISVSYFMDENNDPYVVYLPGYDSYVSGIFEVSENDWRDRFVFSTTWTGLKKLEMDYPAAGQNSFVITAGQMFPEVTGITAQDTSRVMNYVELFRTFAVDQYLDSGRVARYDSLADTKPWAVLTVDAVSLTKPCTVQFAQRLPGDPLMVGTLNGNQTVLFSFDRIKEIFKIKSYFRK